MPPPVKYLLTLIALLAVGSAQVLGIGKGWLCHCSGEAEFSTSADCAEADCHQDHDAGGGHTEGHSHEHELLREPLQSTGFVPVVPAPPAMVDLVLPEWLQPLPVNGRKLADAPDEARPPPEELGTCRHLRVSVAMSMVLLV